MSVRKRDYNAIDWHSIVYYDPTSPTGLRWKVDRRYNAKAGGVAGMQRLAKGHSRCILRICSKQYFTHTIIYILHYGKIDDDKVVDHIDGDSTNNRIENLRAILPLYNNHNRKLQANNKSGITGVQYVARAQSWVAQVRCNGVRSAKTFACRKYGHENAKQMAIDFVINKRLELNASGHAAFTDRHIGIDTSINSSSKQENTLDACFQQD